MRKNGKSSDLFQLIDRKKFDELVSQWEMDKWVRELKTWEFTCALLTMMMTRLSSYREVEQTLRIPRSTFSDAMRVRFYGFFEDLCDHILLTIRDHTRSRQTKRAIRQLLAIDSTECRVHGSLFSESGWRQKRAHGHQAASKMHVVWNVDGEWIEDFIITGVRRHDSPVSLRLELASDKTYVFDRAYNDLNFWLKIMNAGSHFVTRLKGRSIAMIRDGQKIKINNGKQDGMIYDGIYEPHLGSMIQAKIPADIRLKLKFRYIIYRDPVTKKVFSFVTSDFQASAQVIADIYKRRWAVELLFRWLKGHLDIRYLAHKNKNAVRIQLAVAVLLQLLLQLKKLTDKFSGTLWELLRMIRTTFIRESLSLGRTPDGCRWKSSLEEPLAEASQ